MWRRRCVLRHGAWRSLEPFRPPSPKFLDPPLYATWTHPYSYPERYTKLSLWLEKSTTTKGCLQSYNWVTMQTEKDCQHFFILHYVFLLKETKIHWTAKSMFNIMILYSILTNRDAVSFLISKHQGLQRNRTYLRFYMKTLLPFVMDLICTSFNKLSAAIKFLLLSADAKFVIIRTDFQDSSRNDFSKTPCRLSVS